MTPFTQANDRSRLNWLEGTILVFATYLASNYELPGSHTLAWALLSAGSKRASRETPDYPLGFIRNYNAFVIETGRQYVGIAKGDTVAVAAPFEAPHVGEFRRTALTYDETQEMILAKCREFDGLDFKNMDIARGLARAALLRSPPSLQQSMIEHTLQYDEALDAADSRVSEMLKAEKLN
jgi:hypothetical protein